MFVVDDSEFQVAPCLWHGEVLVHLETRMKNEPGDAKGPAHEYEISLWIV